MRKFTAYPFLFVLSIFLFSCNDEEGMDPEVKGTATFTVSGEISQSLDYEEVEFAYTVSSVSGGEISSFTLYLGNYPATETALSISIVEQGNATGFDEKTYTYEELTSASTSSSTSGFISTYITESDAYSINPDAGEVNKLTFKKITDSLIEGSFELNLENNSSKEKIKLTGTFEAVGEAAKI